jgi:hypothetical protein
VQDFPNDRCFPAINIKSRREDDQIRTTLQRHERRHGGVNAEYARFVIARGQHAATIPRAADTDWLSAQSRPVPHFDRRVKAIHVEVNDCARSGIGFHSAI